MKQHHIMKKLRKLHSHFIFTIYLSFNAFAFWLSHLKISVKNIIRTN